MSARCRKFLIAALAALVGTAAAQTAPSKPVSERTSEETARALVQAMSANDAARLRALFAANASQAYGSGKAKSGADFLAWLQSDIIDAKGRVDGANYAANGNEVVITGQFSNSRGYRSAANFLLLVEQGKIVSWRMRY
jgi:ketosteroid isomerase-like protein